METKERGMGGTGQTGRRRRRSAVRAALLGVAAAATAAAGLALPAAPSVAAAQETPTVYIASDSTAQTYEPAYEPQAGWGQLLGQFFTGDVTIANHSIGGRSSRTFIEEGRLDAILNEIQPGDYLFVQFGHNDATISVPERYTSPEDYKEFLRDDYIAGAVERGATPVIVTPVQRRDYDPATGRFNVSFPEYVEKAVEVAAEENVPLLDLNAASRAYLDAIGPEEARSVFLHLPPGVYPERPGGTIDETHFQEYGATQMARLVAQEVAGLDVPLAELVTNTGPPPTAPDSPAGLAATNVSHEGARLSWDAAPGAELYRIQARATDEPDAGFAYVTSSPIPLADVAGLAESTAYELRVVAVNGRGESRPSGTIALTTTAADARYDFGPAEGPVADGFAGVTPETSYTAERGYGFTAATGLTATDRPDSGMDAMARDFVSYPAGTYAFAADVPNGTYAVTAYVGDASEFSRSGFVFEGSDRGQVIGATGSVKRQAFTLVPVEDGQLNVELYGETAHLNGLVLTRVD
jgi:lysophospholipase L1-like esterase